MGNKIITEKDFWICTGGTTPAQLQTTQLTTKKESGHKYITVADTATSSWIDFGCKKLMWIMAILAAVVVVLVVATGGAALGALIAAGAIAGAAGAAFGAVVGALICGQKAAAARKWLTSKPDMIIQGRRAISGDNQMKCMLFGETITFAPHIKNWWQAIALGAANYIGGIMEGMMYGAAIGAAGGVISGGPAVLSQFGVSNVAANWLATWSGWGLGLRGAVTAQSVLGAYGNTGEVTTDDVVSKGIFGMETGTLHSAQNIVSGNGTMTDLIGLGLWFLPAHGRSNEARETRTRTEEARNEEAREEENPQARGNESKAPRRQGEFEAYEEGICFPAGTSISTVEGLRPIEDVRVGELIYAFDFDSETPVVKKVLGLTRGATGSWVDVYIGQEALRVTRAHPIWVESARLWVNAEELTPGVTLRLQDGRSVQVSRVEIILLEEKEETFNFSVEDAENFFVGDLRVLVHNIDDSRLEYLSRPGYRNYVLREGGPNGKIYYSGMFGPGETVADVKRRHSRNNNRFNESEGDYFDLQEGTREYGEARLMENELAVENKTIIGRDGKNYRGNRQRPLDENKMAEYEEYRRIKQGCG